MEKQTMSTMWESTVSNSISNPKCRVCGKEKDTTDVKHPFKDEVNTVYVACKCEIDLVDNFKHKQKAKEKRRKINRILKMSSELDKIKGLTFENYITREGTEVMIDEVTRAVHEFEDNKKGLFIFGVTGNGKSHITAAGGNELLNKGYSVIYLTEKDMLNRLNATKNFNNHETFNEVMGAAVEADLLIWDDFLSSTKLNGDEKDWMFQIINGRERANRPIWYTSNLTAEEFQSEAIQYVLDKKGRTWWRILENTIPVFNRATNYRRENVMNRVKGLK